MIFRSPLRLIIAVCVKLKIHPNVLTFTGVVINTLAGWTLAMATPASAVRMFAWAGAIVVVANIFDFIDGKVANETGKTSKFGGFWDSVIDRFSDLALSVGLICLYASLGRVDYVLITSVAMVFATMTSYTRARAESLIPKCKVGFMERPERIVLFIIGAFTNRMAGALWVILVLSILAVANRVYYTYLVLNQRPLPSRQSRRGLFSRVFFWTDERATLAYDLWAIAILAFVWLTPPNWIGDPRESGPGLIGLIGSRFQI